MASSNNTHELGLDNSHMRERRERCVPKTRSSSISLQWLVAREREREQDVLHNTSRWYVGSYYTLPYCWICH